MQLPLFRCSFNHSHSNSVLETGRDVAVGSLSLIALTKLAFIQWINGGTLIALQCGMLSSPRLTFSFSLVLLAALSSCKGGSGNSSDGGLIADGAPVPDSSLVPDGALVPLSLIHI